jgi:hypothetical protein
MSVLFLTHHVLDTEAGGSYASRAFINAFAALSGNCILVYPETEKEIRTYLRKEVHPESVFYKPNKIKTFLNYYRGKIHRYYQVFPEILKQEKPEIVVFDNSRCSLGLIRLAKKEGCKTIVIHHNYEMEYYRDSPPPWYIRHAFFYYMARAEREAVRLCDLNLCLTVEDIRLLQTRYDPTRQAHFERIGVFEYTSSPAIFPSDRANKKLTFVISGSLSSYQSEQSLIPFITRYYPILLRHFPGSKLILAGRNPSVQLRETCRNHLTIEIIPNPADMASVVEKADIYINPTNLGGGLKLRIMDGLKAGLPVLTHVVSERGYSEFREAGILFSYQDEKSFEDTLLEIVHRFKSNCFSKEFIIGTYRQLFSFESGKKRLKTILEKEKINYYTCMDE